MTFRYNSLIEDLDFLTNSVTRLGLFVLGAKNIFDVSIFKIRRAKYVVQNDCQKA